MLFLLVNKLLGYYAYKSKTIMQNLNDSERVCVTLKYSGYEIAMLFNILNVEKCIIFVSGVQYVPKIHNERIDYRKKKYFTFFFLY